MTERSGIGNGAFRWRLRVYYEDTDAQGVVYYANYFRFLERARTEWLRALGVDQARMMDVERRIFVVVSTEAEFVAPARFNDEIDVTAALAETRRATFDIEQRIFRGEDLLLRSRVRVAVLDAETLKPQRVPKTLFQGN